MESKKGDGTLEGMCKPLGAGKERRCFRVTTVMVKQGRHHR